MRFAITGRRALLSAAFFCAVATASLPAAAQHAGCKPFSQSAVVNTLKRDSGQVTARDLAELIERYEEGVRLCEMDALITIVAGKPELGREALGAQGGGTDIDGVTQECLGGRRRMGLSKALLTLGLLRTPWSVGARPGEGTTAGEEMAGTLEAKARLRSSIRCLDRSVATLVQSPELRNVRRAMEQALANTDGGYATLLQMREGSCEQIKAKIEQAKAVRNAEAVSEIAIKTVIVETVARMGAAQMPVAENSGRICMTHEAAMRGTIASIDEVRESGLMTMSMEGWRWANDLATIRSIYLAALGDLTTARAEALAIAQAALDPPSPLYTNAMHPAARQLLSQMNARRSGADLDPYKDQVFVSRNLPGYGTSRPRRRYLSNGDVAAALLKTIDVLGQRGPEGFPCMNGCKPLLDRISQILSTTMIQTDVAVVTGSFQDEENAERGVDDSCAIVADVLRNVPPADLRPSDLAPCPFSREKVGRSVRVSSRPMSEAKAKALRDIFSSRKLPVFLSRPRITDPL